MIELFHDVFYYKGQYYTKDPSLSKQLAEFMRILDKREAWTLDEEEDFDFIWFAMQTNIPETRGKSVDEVAQYIKSKIVA